MIAEQFNIFEATKPKYKITKPIRLVELFAGIGSQSQALKNIGANFEHYRVVDFDKYAIDSYNAIHNTNFAPLDITKITAKDLGIVETDKYDYIMTYSFPCQDLSPAGKGAGMSKGENTRSGLLWEVERLLKECKELPQILLMENVPQVIGKKNLKDFREWQLFLEKLGYSNYFELLNAKDYGIPQNRNRCFMVSVLGDYYYQFPRKQPLKLRLKDILENEVDEKFYLSEKMIDYVCSRMPLGKHHITTGINMANKNDEEFIAGTICTEPGNKPSDNYLSEVIKVGETDSHQKGGVYSEEGISPTLLESHHKQPVQVIVKGNYSPSGHSASRVVDKEGLAPTVMENHGTVTAIVEDSGYSEKSMVVGGAIRNRPDENGKNKPNLELRKDSLSNALTTFDKDNIVVGGELRRDEGLRTFKDDVIGTLRTIDAGGDKVVVSHPPLRIRKLTPKECWRLMGFSDEDFDKASKVNSNSQLYKQAGNSIVVNVLEAIFKELIE